MPDILAALSWPSSAEGMNGSTARDAGHLEVQGLAYHRFRHSGVELDTMPWVASSSSLAEVALDFYERSDHAKELRSNESLHRVFLRIKPG